MWFYYFYLLFWDEADQASSRSSFCSERCLADDAGVECPFSPLLLLSRGLDFVMNVRLSSFFFLCPLRCALFACRLRKASGVTWVPQSRKKDVSVCESCKNQDDNLHIDCWHFLCAYTWIPVMWRRSDSGTTNEQIRHSMISNNQERRWYLVQKPLQKGADIGSKQNDTWPSSLEKNPRTTRPAEWPEVKWDQMKLNEIWPLADVSPLL